MSENKNPLEGLSVEEIKFLDMLATIFVKSLIKKVEEHNQLALIFESKKIK